MEGLRKILAINSFVKKARNCCSCGPVKKLQGWYANCSPSPKLENCCGKVQDSSAKILPKKCQSFCDYWLEIIIAVISIILFAIGFFLLLHLANADIVESQLSIDCRATKNISKARELGVENPNFKLYLVQTVKNKALSEAISNDDFDTQKTICNAEMFRGESVFGRVLLSFLLMILGGVGFGFLGIRFKHELNTWYEPTAGKVTQTI